MWQEILDQQKLGQGYQDDPLLESLGNREEIFARHLQLIDAKVKASYVLVRLRELRHLWDAPPKRPAAVGALPPPPPSPVLDMEPVLESPEVSNRDGGPALHLSHPTAVGEHEPVIEPPPEAPPDAEKHGSC